MYEYNLYYLMRTKGYTQRELARRLEVGENTFSSKMKGVHEFTWGEIVKLCRILDIKNPLTVFWSETDEH